MALLYDNRKMFCESGPCLLQSRGNVMTSQLGKNFSSSRDCRVSSKYLSSFNSHKLHSVHWVSISYSIILLVPEG